MKYLGGNRGTVTFLYHKDQVSQDALVEAVRKANKTYRVSVGEPSQVPELKGDVDFRAVSVSDSYAIEPVNGKVTIVHMAGNDIADTLLGLKLDEIAQKHGCAVRKIVLEGKGARKQFESEFPDRKTPWVRVYGADGAIRGEGSTADEIEKLCR